MPIKSFGDIRLEADLRQQVPFGRFEFVTVTFSLGADTDTDIATTLTPANPEDVRYLVVSADRSTNIYHDQSSTRRAWPEGYLVLRSSAASAVCRLLVFTENS